MKQITPEEIMQAVVEQSQTMTRPVFRGQADADWEPESGAVHRLREAYGDDIPKAEGELRNMVAEYHRERLIMPMQVMDGADWSDLQRLSVLQHQGAAPGLWILLKILWLLSGSHAPRNWLRTQRFS